MADSFVGWTKVFCKNHKRPSYIFYDDDRDGADEFLIVETSSSGQNSIVLTHCFNDDPEIDKDDQYNIYDLSLHLIKILRV